MRKKSTSRPVRRSLDESGSALARHSCGEAGFFNRRTLLTLLICGAAACCIVSGTPFAFFRPEAASKVSHPAAAGLTFGDRVAYQRAIEEIYWRHRIWPNANPGPKPSLDAVMSQAEIEKRVEDYLRNSQVLEDYWRRPITADQLQTEMERMASHTKQPGVLRELFAALGNDPFVIAECLARPVLAERLVSALKNEESVQLTTVAWLRNPLQSKIATAEGQPPKKVAAIETRSLPSSLAAAHRGFTFYLADPSARLNSTPKAFGVQVLQRMRSNGQAFHRTYHLPRIASPSGNCIDDTWTPTTLTNAPAARDGHTTVWTGSEMIVWGGIKFDAGFFNPGGRYDPSTDSWTATTTTKAPEDRFGHSAVWTGSEMIVWGGTDVFSDFNSGGRYDPGRDKWRATSTTNAPPGRYNHTAVWTGSEMIVWGGGEEMVPVGRYYDTGGRYDPVTDSWIATSTTNAPEARIYHTAVWADTGSEMIVWGGLNGSFYINTGGRYDPGTDSWTATTTTNAPFARGYIDCQAQGAVWTGSEMIVWGGSTGGVGYNTGGRYDPSTDSWTATSVTNAPGGRTQHATVWTGSEMIIWGGWDDFNFWNTGGSYNPGTNSWTATSTANAPDARFAHTAVWTGSEMIIWGGRVELFTDSNTGGRYCAAAPSPTPRPQPTPRPRPTPVTRP